MAVVSGGVNVTVAVNGVGTAPKVVSDTSKGIEGLGQKIGTAMKGAVGPLNQVKEGFERVRGNALFVVGVAASLVAGLGSLADAFSGNAKAIAAWEAVQKNVPAALERTGELIDEIQVKLGKRPAKTDLERLGEVVAKAWEGNKGLIEAATGAVVSHRDNMAIARKHFGEWSIAFQNEEKALHLAQTNLNALFAKQGVLLRENIDLIREQARAALPKTVWNTKSNIFGELETPEQEQARKMRLYAAIAANQPVRGGGGSRPDISLSAPGADARAIGAISGAPAYDENRGDKTANRLRTMSDSFDQVSEWGGYIRDFTSALSDSLPGMDAFASALGGISSMWGEYAQGNKSAAQATIFSVGAIAKAGAEQIKNERLRAGVLSTIELGLGSASIAVYDYPAAAAHFTAAAVLGSVAIFGGGGGGGGSKDKNRAPTRSSSLSERTSSGAVNFIINGTYIAGHSGQETAAELHRLMRSGGGGFVPSGAA